MRVGNAAHAQLQLDVYGELIDAFHQWRMAKLELDEDQLGAGMHRAASILAEDGTGRITASGSGAARAGITSPRR